MVDRPLTWTDTSGNVYRYFEKPLIRACSFILVLEMCERLAFYGLQPTLKSFLRSRYGFTDVDANSLVSLFSGLTCTLPIVSAILADTLLGSYKTIVWSAPVYLLGLVCMVIAAAPGVDAVWLVYLALFALIPIGTSGIKSGVCVLGGAQMHPIIQKQGITTFFTLFYGSINVGALIGGSIVPIMAQEASYFTAYIVPAAFMLVAIMVIVAGSGRYVIPKPQGSAAIGIVKVIGSGIRKLSMNKCRKSQGGEYDDHFIDDSQMLFALVPFFGMTVPFAVCYIQIFTGFESQSVKMQSTIFGAEMPHELICNVDSIAVIVGSVLLDSLLYPYLRKIGKMPSVLYLFVLGYICGIGANLCAVGVEYAINANAPNTVSIWWQVPQFALIAIGEIFIFSTALEVGFTKAPDSLRSVATALNSLSAALSGYIATAIIELCKPWIGDDGDHFDYFFITLACMCVFFGLLCIFTNAHFERVFKRADELQQQHAMSTAAELPEENKDI